MKKILSLGVAAAVLSLTAVAASAAIAPVVSDTATAGGSIVVEVVANSVETPYATFTVETSENLTLTASEANAVGLFNPANMMFTFASATAPADGTVLLTLTFDVAAAADEEVYVSLKAVDGDVDPTAVTLTVVDATETDVTDESFEEPTSEESFEEPTEDTWEPTIDPGETEQPAEPTEEPNDNPPTGIALAVVPALVAGAAVVASKKRK